MGAVVVGIDLGTTNSCVAVYKDGKVEIIPTEDGFYVIPSMVGFTENGIITGHEAKNEAHKYIKNTVFEIKRLIGQRYKDEKVQEDIKSFPYEVIDDQGTLKVAVTFRGKTEKYFPEEISSFVLQKLKKLAESHLGQSVTRAVVTVPAYFNDIQRQATKDAAAIAGFQKTNVINEPTAAALAFSYQSPKPYKRNVLVYDFGGGTFDVSIVDIGRGKCVVKATRGDLHLGGTDVDANLVNFVKKDFREQFGEEMAEDEMLRRRIKARCEQVKEKLSGTRQQVDIELDGLSGKDYYKTISRTEFERLNSSLFEKTMEVVKGCLEDAGLTRDQIDNVVLVGGSSRIPKVRQMLKSYFGQEKISEEVNPDEAVAYGAAIHAMHLHGDKCEVEDVISLSLGIAVLNLFESDPYLSNVLIPRNTSIPTTYTRQYHTSCDDQEAVSIMVHQGESPMADDNYQLGSFVLSGLSKGPAGSVKYDVCFEIDSEGILEVTASEVGCANSNGIKIDVSRKGLSQSQVENRIAEMETHMKEDLARTKLFLDKYNLESLCHTTADKAARIVDPDLRTAILDKCNDICEWLQNISIDDREELERKQEEVEDLYSISDL